MLLPGHVGGSYLVAAGCAALFRRTTTRALALFTLGAGLVSDIDVAPVVLRVGWDAFGQAAGEHRASMLHTPLFAVVVGAIAFALPTRTRWLWAAAGSAAVIGHLILDSVTIGPGVMWLYPWTDTLYGINLANTRYGTDWGEQWLWRYVRHPLFLIEIGLLGAAALVWSRTRERPGRRGEPSGTSGR